MTSGPKVRLGTKTPSMTSHWMRSTPASHSSATSSPRRAKSAGRTEGTMSGCMGVTFLMRSVRSSSDRGGRCGHSPAWVERRVKFPESPADASEWPFDRRTLDDMLVAHPAPPTPLRLVLVDDHEMVLHGLDTMLGHFPEEVVIVGEATTG